MPPAKSPATSYDSIVRDIKAGKFAPVYYLMGEESYYIDRLSDLLVASLLSEDEQAFNLITVFGADVTIDQVMDTAKGFPMGAQRLVVLVKEAQNIKEMDRLEYYLQQPQPTTVLIFSHKNGTIDKRTKVATQVKKVGVLFESIKLRDYQLSGFISTYLRERGAKIEPEAAALLAEDVGDNLSRMVGELDKLLIGLPEGNRVVTKERVASNIGVSNEYNVFELQDAIGAKNVRKAMKIAYIFDKNTKANPIQKTLPVLFRFFMNLMQAHYAPDKSPAGLNHYLGVSEWMCKNKLIPAMQNYSAGKTMRIIDAIRRTDARSKGVENPATSDGDLMKELLFFMMH